MEDRRGRSAGFGGRRGFGGGLPGLGRGIPIPRTRLGLLVVIVMLVVGALSQSGWLEGPGGRAPGGARDGQAAEFVSVVLADTEEVWSDLFKRELGGAYEPPTLVLFTGAVRSACGGATSASGPFYCPADEKAYLDTAFFDALSRDLGAQGDFAAAYVIAHEIGHHVQNELGMLAKAVQAKDGRTQGEANAVQVQVELQADCFAGVWAARAQEMFDSLEPGDIDEALNAASRIGDDTLQREAGRTVRPETFQHGTSEQRRNWFARGWNGGTIAACDPQARRL